ncbi:MAG: tRNA (adenosine(37)-N6)-threonylcarbamoyltransferase complex dimerization subunit type 1 TsaB [Candidatus Marinimicrobia bacterium]|nr:tRNA (adenosine(37)-N6)-threonylcarbamoyltransferase complex dimerization subunit type 1 TsaB [Candidatus Neomarinimicrobiota bacterium]
MNILSFETSSSICGLAFHKNGKLIDEIYLDQPRIHSEKLVELTENLLKNNNLEIKNIDLITISNGPGSFTGLRIGMSFAVGLAFPYKIPIAPVNTIMAYMANQSEKITNYKLPVFIFHSHRDYIFTATPTESKIKFIKINEFENNYSNCDIIFTNKENLKIDDIKTIYTPILPSIIGEYYLNQTKKYSTIDYGKIQLNYGQEYKPKKWRQ